MLTAPGEEAVPVLDRLGLRAGDALRHAAHSPGYSEKRARKTGIRTV